MVDIYMVTVKFFQLYPICLKIHIAKCWKKHASFFQSLHEMVKENVCNEEGKRKSGQETTAR